MESRYERVLNIYQELGYPRDLVLQWALPERDVGALVAQLESHRPVRVLEVGTFVGVATMLLAMASGEDVCIDTVDPNFPLEVELDAMGTEGRGANLAARHHEIALHAAERLGVDRKIRFHAGGFSTGSTFASSKTDPGRSVPVVGPEVCANHGPFDLIFIDGLHYTPAVLGDLRLAAEHLAPGGRIILHDVVGMWGSNVRRAVYQFLVEKPDFAFRHPPYARIYESIGLLERRGDPPSGGTSDVLVGSLIKDGGFLRNLASILMNVVRPRSAVCLGEAGAPLLQRLSALGVEDAHLVGATSEDARLSGEPFDVSELSAWPRRFDLCILLENREWDVEQCEAIIASAVRCSDTILLGVTPPGEAGVAGRAAQPIARWVREFCRHGYRLCDSIRPALEPLQFSFTLSPIYTIDSSALCNLYLVRREPFMAVQLDQFWVDMMVEKEARIEDLTLQGVFKDVALRDTLLRWKAAQDEFERAASELERTASELAKTASGWSATQEALDGAMHELACRTLPDREFRIAQRLEALPWISRLLARLL